MQTSPTEISLELKPRARYDLIDVTQHISERVGDLFHRYRKALYCSFHTVVVMVLLLLLSAKTSFIPISSFTDVLSRANSACRGFTD